MRHSRPFGGSALGIYSRERERHEDVETGEWKYLVKGNTVEGVDVVVVSKLSPTGKLIIITIYVE